MELVQQGDGPRIGGHGRLAQLAKFVQHTQRIDAPAEGIRPRRQFDLVGGRWGIGLEASL